MSDEPTASTNAKLKLQLNSSLPLQMALHYNAYFLPFLLISTISCLIIKYYHLSPTYRVILCAIYIIYYSTEIVRLSLGYYGNLAEKIPALSGFWVTSLVLQLPISLFLQLNQSIMPLPLERAVFAIHTVFLFAQICYGFFSIRKIAEHQIRYFKGLLADED